MKALNNVLKILTILFSLSAVVLFFTNFAKIVLADGEVVRTGTELAFGASYNGVEIGKSADLFVCFFLAIFATLFSVLTFKFKRIRYGTSLVSLIAGIYMIVIACSAASKFVDTQGFVNVAVNKTAYVGFGVWMSAIAIVLACISSIGFLFTADFVEVAGTGKLLLHQRIFKFFRDYKGEVSKIVWPGPRAVVKNTLIVLAMCAVVGLFIWAVDFGLGQLVNLVLGV